MSDGPVVLVTGAARGIGRAIAEGFASAGWHVALGDLADRPREDWSYALAGDEELARARDAAAAAGDGDALAVPLDVTDADSCASAVEAALACFGRLDALVNNAGVVQTGSLAETSERDWDRTMAVNVKGVFLMTRAAVPALPEGGSVVNVASIAGRTGYANMSAYCASKFAVMGLTQSLAAELAPRGVRVNAICPGILGTAMWLEHLLPRLREDLPTDPEARDAEFRRTLGASIPLGRTQEPGDVAEAAVYLAGARNVTGTAITVAGGLVLG